MRHEGSLGEGDRLEPAASRRTSEQSIFVWDSVEDAGEALREASDGCRFRSVADGPQF